MMLSAGVSATPGPRRALSVVLAVVAICAAVSLARGAAAGTDPDPGSGPPQALREFVRVVDRPFVRVGLTVTVTGRDGRPARGLTAGDFQVFEDDRPVRLEDFGVEGERVDRRLSVAILLDLSQSMGSQVGRVREAAGALLGTLRPEDEILVAKFNDQLTVLQPWTSDPAGPQRSLSNIGQAWGGTALFRAVAEILKDLRHRPGRKVIIVLSDGLDNDVARDRQVLQSLYLQDLLRLCFRTQTVVYGIRPGMAIGSWLPFERFVEETGGRLLYTGRDLAGLFRTLGEELLAQYYLAYDTDPKEMRPAARRRIRVQVARPDLQVRAMAGFFAPRSQLESLLRDLRDDDAGLRADACYDLGFVDDPQAVRALRFALEDDDVEVRRLAAEALARQADTESVAALVRLLNDRDAAVRRAAADALGSFGPAAIPDLVRAVNRRARGRRLPAGLPHAVMLLGALGDDRALDPLVTLLREGPVAARPDAAAALGHLGLSGGIPALRLALADGPPELRATAAEAILAIAGSAARPVIEDHLAREQDAAVCARLRRALQSAAASP